MRRMNLLRTVFLYIVALVLFHSIFCMRDISVLSFGVYVVLFSVPVILYSFVCTTTAREYRLRNLLPATLLFKLTKSRVMSYMIAVPVYTVLASVSVMNIYLFSTAEYLSFLIIAVVLCTVNSIAKQSFHKLYKAEYVDYYQQRFQLMVMAVCAAAIVSGIVGFLIPKGNYEKPVKILLGLFMLCVITVSFGGGFDFSDIFSDIFSAAFGGGTRSRRRNGPRKGTDMKANIEITFEESYLGTEKTISVNRNRECPKCHGTQGKQSKTHRRIPT